MPGNTVFYHQGSNRSICILGEQYIMTNTKAYNDIKIGFSTVKKPGLSNRVTGRFKGFGPYLFILPEPEFKFVNTAGLAADTYLCF